MVLYWAKIVRNKIPEHLGTNTYYKHKYDKMIFV